MNRPKSRQTLIMGLTLILATSLAGAACAGPLQGEVVFGGGYLDHPRGLEYEIEAAYLSQALRLTSEFPGERHLIRLGYEGYANQFGNDTQLGVMKHGLGAEWFRNPEMATRLKQGAAKGYAVPLDEFMSIWGVPSLDIEILVVQLTAQ